MVKIISTDLITSDFQYLEYENRKKLLKAAIHAIDIAKYVPNIHSYIKYHAFLRLFMYEMFVEIIFFHNVFNY